MAYNDMAALAADYNFGLRINACVTEQANIFINDTRPEYTSLASAAIKDVGTATWFYWNIATQPGFGDAYVNGGSDAITDLQILSAVQAVWPTIGTAHTA